MKVYGVSPPRRLLPVVTPPGGGGMSLDRHEVSADRGLDAGRFDQCEPPTIGDSVGVDIGDQHPGTGAEPVVAGGRVDVVLAPDAQAPAVARSLLEQHGGLLTRDMLADAELLMSEVVGNAVRHGAPEITVTLCLTTATAEVGVHDCGTALPVTPGGPPDPTQTSGRGLLILAALADRWGVDVSGPQPGKTVWFALG